MKVKGWKLLELVAYFIFILDPVFSPLPSDIVDIEIIFDRYIGDLRSLDSGKTIRIFSSLLSSCSLSFFFLLSLLCSALSTSSFGGFCSFNLTLLLSLDQEALISLILSLLNFLFLFFFASVITGTCTFLFFTIGFFIVVFS